MPSVKISVMVFSSYFLKEASLTGEKNSDVLDIAVVF